MERILQWLILIGFRQKTSQKKEKYQVKQNHRKTKAVDFAAPYLSTPSCLFRVLLLVCQQKSFQFSSFFSSQLATILPDLAGHHFKQPYGKEYGR